MAQSKVFEVAVANSAKFSLGCPAPSPSTSVTNPNESQPKKKAARKSKAKPKASPKKVDGLCGVGTIAAVTNLLDDVLNMIDAAVENAEKIDTDKTDYVLGIALQYALQGTITVPCVEGINFPKAFQKYKLKGSGDYTFTSWSAVRLYLVKVLLAAHIYNEGSGNGIEEELAEQAAESQQQESDTTLEATQEVQKLLQADKKLVAQFNAILAANVPDMPDVLVKKTHPAYHQAVTFVWKECDGLAR